MGLKVTHDGSAPGEVAENCCVCRIPTRYWWGKGERNVAICQACALSAKAEDMPTKKDWIAKERSLSQRRLVATDGGG